MIIKCAWCEKIIGTKNFKEKNQKIPLVTHTICKSCQLELFNGKCSEDLLVRKKPQPEKSPLQS
jgi:hypothetical protein